MYDLNPFTVIQYLNVTLFLNQSLICEYKHLMFAFKYQVYFTLSCFIWNNDSSECKIYSKRENVHLILHGLLFSKIKQSYFFLTSSDL